MYLKKIGWNLEISEVFYGLVYIGDLDLLRTFSMVRRDSQKYSEVRCSRDDIDFTVNWNTVCFNAGASESEEVLDCLQSLLNFKFDVTCIVNGAASVGSRSIFEKYLLYAVAHQYFRIASVVDSAASNRQFEFLRWLFYSTYVTFSKKPPNTTPFPLRVEPNKVFISEYDGQTFEDTLRLFHSFGALDPDDTFLVSEVLQHPHLPSWKFMHETYGSLRHVKPSAYRLASTVSWYLSTGKFDLLDYLFENTQLRESNPFKQDLWDDIFGYIFGALFRDYRKAFLYLEKKRLSLTDLDNEVRSFLQNQISTIYKPNEKIYPDRSEASLDQLRYLVQNGIRLDSITVCWNLKKSKALEALVDLCRAIVAAGHFSGYDQKEIYAALDMRDPSESKRLKEALGLDEVH